MTREIYNLTISRTKTRCEHWICERVIELKIEIPKDTFVFKYPCTVPFHVPLQSPHVT